MIFFHYALFLITLFFQVKTYAMSDAELRLPCMTRDSSDTALKNREVTDETSHDLLGLQDDIFTYHHYFYRPKGKGDIKDLYARLIKKGEEILHHLYTSEKPFPHKLDILEHYLDYSPYYFQHGLTFGGISFLRGPCLDQLVEQNAYLESVISIIWGLVDKSFKQGDIFDRGAIILVDPDFRVLEFLKAYVLKVSGYKDWQEFEGNKGAFLESNRAYSRTGTNWMRVPLSSHFAERTDFQAGIDCRFGPSELPMPFFPFSMGHLLFGRVKTLTNKAVTFIKPEPSGLADWRSLVCHSFNYFWSNQGFYLRREKDIPPGIASLIHDLAKIILEAPPKNLEDNSLLRTFQALQSKNLLSPKTFSKSDVIDIASVWLLVKIICTTENELVSEVLKTTAAHLKAKIREIYKSNLSFRTGNEILFTPQDFISENSINSP